MEVVKCWYRRVISHTCVQPLWKLYKENTQKYYKKSRWNPSNVEIMHCKEKKSNKEMRNRKQTKWHTYIYQSKYK